ncbi:MAG: J domain-containing protein [Spirochaetaceae bacterium]|nr:MAG: J domain-containing protein [Spirochaetaceae bacterium]
MAVKFHDYYKTLGIERGASPEQVQAAYRKLARTWHPDVNKSPNAEKKFKEISEAYEVLKDPEKRKRYDTLGANWQAGDEFRPPPGWEGFSSGGRSGGPSFHFKGFDGNESFDFFSGGFSDFFETMFGGSGAGRSGGPGRSGTGDPSRGPSRGARSGPEPDPEAEVAMSLEEAYRGGRRTLTLTVDEPGPGGVMQRHQKNYEVTIPPGIADGKRLRLAGEGGMRRDGTAADLFLRIRINPHPRFRITGSDLEADLPVAPWEAALGAKVAARLPNGSATVTVPAGSQAGKRLRLKGKGLRTDGDTRGDLYLMITIRIPETLSDRERSLFEELAKVSDYDPRK